MFQETTWYFWKKHRYFDHFCRLIASKSVLASLIKKTSCNENKKCEMTVSLVIKYNHEWMNE